MKGIDRCKKDGREEHRKFILSVLERNSIRKFIFEDGCEHNYILFNDMKEGVLISKSFIDDRGGEDPCSDPHRVWEFGYLDHISRLFFTSGLSSRKVLDRLCTKCFPREPSKTN